MAANALVGFALAYFALATTSIIHPVWSHEFVLLTDPQAKNVRIPAGESFNITCYVGSAEEEDITSLQWLHENRVVTNARNKVVTRDGEKRLTLTISNVTTADSGIYHCSGIYKRNEILKKEINLRAYLKVPKFGNNTEEIVIEESSELQLLSYASGTPPIMYEWYNQYDKRISSLNNSISISEGLNGSLLTFYYVSANHSGLYRCSARNKYGFDEKWYYLNVTLKEKTPTFEISHENITAGESSNIEITCHADGAPPITYEWYDQNGKQVFSSVNSSTCVSKNSNVSVLAIYNVKANHSEFYTCNASNAFGLASKVFEVIVVNKEKKPTFEVTYEKITADESSNIEIPCHADGSAPITYEWHDQNGKRILSSINSSTCVSTSSNASVLTVYNVKANNSEFFICNASNEFGVSSKVYEVVVINKGKKPTFDTGFENVTVKEYSTIQFHCCAKGTPPVIYEWHNQNNQTISSVNGSISISESLNGSVLSIYEVTAKHSGFYKCNARNRYGLAEKLYFAGVILKGDIPTFEIDYENITVEESSNLEITCYASGSTPINYEWYDQNNQRIVTVNGSVFITETQNVSVLSIYGIATNQSGSYMCRARNRYGIAEKRHVVEVTPEGKMPTFENNYEEITVEEFSNVEITCQADGTKPIKYEWYDQKENMISSSINSSTCVSKSSNASVLAIYNVKANHSELYICNASNEFGVTSKVYEIIVIPKENHTVDEIIAFEDIKTLKIGTNNVTFDISLQKKFLYIDVFAVDTRNRGGGQGVYRRWYPGDAYVIPRLISAVQYEFHFEISMPDNTMLKGVITETLRPEPIEIGIFKLGNGSIGFELLLLSQDPLRKTMDKYELTYYSIKRMASNKWTKFTDDPVITVLPGSYLFHTIAGLYPNNYYELKVRIHTAGGYGEPYFQKVYAV